MGSPDGPADQSYKDIFDAANDAIFVHDLQTGRILDMNQRALELYGVAPDGVASLAVGDLSTGVAPHSQAEASSWLKKAIEEGPQLFEWMAKSASGRTFWVEVNIKRVRLAGEDRLLAMVRDISERKRAQEEHALLAAEQARLAEAQRTEQFREDFLRGLAHDLVAPLSAVKLHAQSLQRGGARLWESNRGPQAVEGVLKGVAHMTSMVRELVEAVRLEGGQLALDCKPLDLGAFLPELFDRLAPALPPERIVLELPGALPWVLADAERLERVVVNLVTNALKFSPAERPVKIGARAGGEAAGAVTLWVRDEGPGIAADERARVFERYYRSRAGAQHADGIGLGLYIVRMLVEAHGGRVWLESEPGQGSRFLFTLPAAPSSAP